MSTPEEVLAAHYAAFPHVAKQLKVGEASPAPATAVHDKQAPAGAAGLPAADPRAMPLIAEVRAYTVEVKKKEMQHVPSFVCLDLFSHRVTCLHHYLRVGER